MKEKAIIVSCETFDERAAIIEYDGKIDREQAELYAMGSHCWDCLAHCEKKNQLQLRLQNA